MSGVAILDEEVVLRHIPGGQHWQVPPEGRISSMNLRLRPGELGISVSRLITTTPALLLDLLGNRELGSKIAWPLVQEIRSLGFDVIADPIEVDRGHALIVPVTADLERKSTLRALASAFSYFDLG